MKSQILIVSSCILLCSCSHSTPVKDTPLPAAFSVTADITDGDFSCTADMTRSSDGWDIIITSPPTVEGVTLHIDGEQMSVRSGDLSFTNKHDDILQASPVRLTAAVLDRCVSRKTEGEIYGQHYAAQIEDGQPKQLVAGTELNVQLHDFVTNEAQS